ncbi:TetR/AcrR family transcriptional regulator [Trujillonella endophytica]|uniref:Transcriptional regulator, TetR family n=1 Tax=Trujillonella endophytica TaxID=673521 RepID=A0A1H8UPB8_9ACTN|nr:TetR/AcrR family transcriptional regulator [Trujillella endophytica]SEP04936.1 transcriptional regulator, TetR family [Trujillella endophytica]
MSEEVLGRVVQRALAQRGMTYEEEVRRLLDAGLEVMIRCGTAASPRVSDIVAAAGLSNDAFYRYFPSKGALVAALLEHGTERLRSYLAHQMAKESTPEGRIRRWVEGVLIQAQDDVAATTRAVMWNAPTAGSGAPYGRHFASEVLAALIEPSFAELGNPSPERNATFVTYATLGVLAEHVWAETVPTAAEQDELVTTCLTVARAADRAPAGVPQAGPAS